MKKISLAALALLACAAAQAQTTFGVEYDYHKFNSVKAHSHYWATGIMQGTRYGTFDAWLQGSHNMWVGTKDTLQGWELGYSKAFPVGPFTLIPRIAYGAMNNIGLAPGVEGRARYVLTTLEASHPIRDGLSVFANISHTKGVNADAIQSWNRATAGTDISLTKQIGLRLGASYIRQLQLNQVGGYAVVTYTLGE